MTEVTTIFPVTEAESPTTTWLSVGCPDVDISELRSHFEEEKLDIWTILSNDYHKYFKSYEKAYYDHDVLFQMKERTRSMSPLNRTHDICLMKFLEG
ncbi:hypothetical protein HPP92_011047 [Vanilla planifolia]|uniref:Uncharacterized protein n=1 Tax=Vanilla planifolia TaxID=51239 RepID=A0A835UY32_VANPL|nr:hypothetical protein HPP92_011047 [Vanilla planifolia]